MNDRHQLRSRWLTTGLSILLVTIATGVVLAGESIGVLRPGMTTGEIAKTLGKPLNIEEQPPECPGDAPLLVWDYSDRGLVLVVEGRGANARLESISNFGENRLPTDHGITIGATYDQVLAAYPSPADPSPESFQVDLETGFLEISFSGDDPPRVIRVLVTSQPPMIYEEGQDCGRKAD